MKKFLSPPALSFALVFGIFGLAFMGFGHLEQGPQRYWIMTHSALDEVITDPKAKAALANDIIYVGGINPSNLTANESGLHLVPTLFTKSEATIASDIANHTIPSYDKAVLYDNEPWTLTPQNERDDPVTYYKKAGTLLHAHGYQLVSTPVPNKYAPLVAPYSDVVDVQAQYAQATVTKYLNAVKTNAINAKNAPNHPIVLTGISTNPSSGDPTPQQLLNIAHATFPSIAQGWWLNIPSPSSACPNCNQPRPDIAISFLKLLGPNGSSSKSKPSPNPAPNPSPNPGSSSSGGGSSGGSSGSSSSKATNSTGSQKSGSSGSSGSEQSSSGTTPGQPFSVQSAAVTQQSKHAKIVKYTARGILVGVAIAACYVGFIKYIRPRFFNRH